MSLLDFFQNNLMVNIELAQKLEKQIMTVLNTAIVGEYKMVHYSYTLIHLSVISLTNMELYPKDNVL